MEWRWALLLLGGALRPALAERAEFLDWNRQVAASRGNIFGVVPGLAFLCRGSCHEEVDHSLMTSPVMDAMEYLDVKVAFALDPCPNNACRIAVCQEDMPDLGYDVEAVRRALHDMSCTLEYLTVEERRLLSLPEDSPDGDPVMVFRDTQVKDFVELIGVVNGHTTPEPKMLGMIRRHDDTSEKAATFAQVLVWYYAGVKGQRDQARIKLWIQEQERLAAIQAALQAARLAEEKRARDEREAAIRAIAAALRDVEDLVRLEFLRNKDLAKVCGAGAGVSEESMDLRTQLNLMQKAQREEDKSAMKDIAVASFEAAFAALCVAADFGVPGVGSALNAVRVALTHVIAYGTTFMNPNVLAAIARAKDVLAMIDGDGGSSFGLGGFGDTVVNSALSAGQGELAGAVYEEVKDIESNVFKNAPKYFQAAKEVIKAMLVAGATEGAWTAVQFIPFIGPFVGLGRGIATLYDVHEQAFASKQEYFKRKDPILRSLFRMRDCALDSVNRVGAARLAEDQTKDWDVRVAALLSAIDASEAAASINEDLTARLFKRVWLVESKKTHEDAVMVRLRTGYPGKVKGVLIGMIPINKTAGDSWLHEAVIAPTEWQARFGDSIRRAYPEMRRAADAMPKPRKPRDR